MCQQGCIKWLPDDDSLSHLTFYLLSSIYSQQERVNGSICLKTPNYYVICKNAVGPHAPQLRHGAAAVGVQAAHDQVPLQQRHHRVLAHGDVVLVNRSF